jgi:uncharacterized protein (DUF885 family)
MNINMEENKVADQLNNISTEYIIKKLTEIAENILTEEVSQIEVTVVINIPTQIHDIVKHIANNTGTDIQQLYSKLCTINLKNKINEILKDRKDLDTVSLDNTQASELTNLNQKIKEFENAMGLFEKMQSSLGSLEQIAEVLKEKNEKK